MKATGLKGILLIACLLAGSTVSIEAAPIPDGTGILTGKVLIAGTRTAIEGATVTAVGADESYTATTDGSGVYTIFPITGGYTVTATADGYNNQTFSVTIRSGKKTRLNFFLSNLVNTEGILEGQVTDAASGDPLIGAEVSTNIGGYSDLTDAGGQYSMDVSAGTYNLTASLDGYQSMTETVSVTAGQTTTTDFTLDQIPAGLSITNLTADHDSYVEAGAETILLTATVEGTPTGFLWTQLSGPKVPLAATDITASDDVSSLEVAAECELVFELTVTEAGNAASKTVTALVQPFDMLQYPGPNVQIGGSSTAVARFQYEGDEWTLFNIGTSLKATTVGTSKGIIYEIILPGIVYDIETVSYTHLRAHETS